MTTLLKEISLQGKLLSEIPESEIDKLPISTSWDTMWGWFLDSWDNLFEIRPYSNEISDRRLWFRSNEVVNDFKTIADDNGLLSTDWGARKWSEFGDNSILKFLWMDKNNYEDHKNRLSDVWRTIKSGGKCFKSDSCFTPQGFRFFKKYLRNVKVDCKLVAGKNYSDSFIKSEIDKGTIKAADIVDTSQPVVVKDPDKMVSVQELEKLKQEFQDKLDKEKEIRGKLVDKWNADLFNDFGLKPLSVDSLGLVKEKLDALNTQVNNLTNERDAAKDKYTKLLAEKEARPDISLDEYKNLKNNQEKHTEKDLEHHKPEDLKPTNLPADWEKQIQDKKDVEAALAQAKAKLEQSEKDKESFKNYVKGKLGEKDTEIGQLKAKVTQLEAQVNQKPVSNLPDSSSTTSPTPTPLPSKDKDTSALQSQKQTKENELQKYLQSLKSRLGDDYSEDNIKSFLQTEIKLIRANKKSETQSREYQDWKGARNRLLDDGYVKTSEADRISQLQEEITKLEMQLEKSLIAQVEVK